MIDVRSVILELMNLDTVLVGVPQVNPRQSNNSKIP
jgi:hypothetical protein